MGGSTQGEFVDSNVLVYAHDVTAGRKREIAKELLTRLWNGTNGCLSIQTLQEFVVNATGKVPQPISAEQAQDVVTALSDWTVHSPEPADVVAALKRKARYKISFWDAMILESAACLGCRLVWSEDLSSGQIYGSVEVRNPFDDNKI